MQLIELLAQITKIASDKGISAPWICGGVPRDKVLNTTITDITDIDITTGDEGSKFLPKELALLLGEEAKYKKLPDGHAQITIGGFKLDFSSNYRAPNIESLLKTAGVKNPSNMIMELYSRDFTCNALLESMDLKTIKDPTGLGIKDIEKKILRTCLPPELTLGNDHKRVVRIIYMCAKLGFEPDPEIIAWVKANPSTIGDAKPKYVAKKLQQAIDHDINKTVKLLDEMGLWKYISMLPELVPYVSEKLGRI